MFLQSNARSDIVVKIHIEKANNAFHSSALFGGEQKGQEREKLFRLFSRKYGPLKSSEAIPQHIHLTRMLPAASQ